MKKEEFVEMWCEVVAESRKANFPAIKPAQAAAGYVDDRKTADIMWRKFGQQFRKMSREQLLRALLPDKLDDWSKIA